VLTTVFPHLAALEVIRAETRGRELVIHAATVIESAACWTCGVNSTRVHSRYRRLLQDAAVTGRSLAIVLQVKRYFCDNESCAKTTFAEQVPGLTSRFGRISEGLRAMLTRVALALGGRAGSRLAEHLAIPSSRDRLIRLVKALPDPEHATPRVLGVDDFAFRRWS